MVSHLRVRFKNCGLSVAERCQPWLEMMEVCASLGGWNGGNMAPAVSRMKVSPVGQDPIVKVALWPTSVAALCI